MSLERLLAPRSMAIVGTSPNGGRGARLHHNLLAGGFGGRLYAIHPREPTVFGTPAFARLADLPEVVDCVALAVPAEATLSLLEECGRLGVGGAVCLASGFGEAGPAGLERQARLRQTARATGMRVCGPNCIGLWNVGAGVAAFSPPLPGRPRSGEVALLSQSGGLLLEVLNPLLERGVGFSHIISTGNEGATTLEEYLAYLTEQPGVGLLVAIVESFKAPERLGAVLARANALDKPVLVLKVGRTEAGQRAAASHTGSLAQDDQVVDAVLRASGAVRVRSTDHLVETVVLFGHKCWPTSSQVALVSSSGGRCTLLGDLAAGVPLELASFGQATHDALAELLPDFGQANNPLDPTGVVFDRDGLYAPMLEAVANDPAVGVVGVFQVTRTITAAGATEQRTHRSVALAREVVDAAHAAESPVVAFTSLTGGRVDPQVVDVFRDGGVPLLLGMDSALAALHSAIDYAAHRRAPKVAPVHRTRPEVSADLLERLGQDGALSEYDAKQLLHAYGVPVVFGELATSADDAERIADSLGYPVALKACGPGIVHKSELGLVKLDLRSPAQLRQAYATLDRAGPVLLVERMAPPGIELIVGARATPFGPLVMVGAGGMLTELVRDTRLRMAPIAHAEALDLLAETRVGQLLRGMRGQPMCDVDAVAGVLVAISHLVCDLPIGELDLNPLVAYERGVVTLDAFVRS